MAKWWQVSWKRVGFALLIIFLTPVLLGGVGFLGYVQLAPWLTARELAKDQPGIELAPTPLPDRSLATLSGERIERFGLSFQLPWKPIDSDRQLKEIAVVQSKSGGSITIHDPSSALGTNSLTRIWVTAIPALNQPSLRSNYALMSAAMEARPERVKWWKTREQNTKDLSLLLMKSFALQTDGPLYLLGSGELRGFQQGNPSMAPYRVKLDIFDSADLHYEIGIDPAWNQGPAITQAEINAMVATMRPASHK